MALALPPPGTFSNPALRESEFQVALEQLLAAVAEAQANIALPDVPVATCFMYGGAGLPVGYLWCRGEVVSRVTYAALFAAIGGYFGAGDGSTTFHLPNFSARSPVGIGNSGQQHTYGLGQKHGTDLQYITVAHMPSHTHTVSDGTHAHAVYDPTHTHGVADPGHAHAAVIPNLYPIVVEGGQGPSPVAQSGVTGVNTDARGTGIWIYGAATGIGIYANGANIGVGYTGSGAAIDNTHAVLAVNFIIKT